MLPADMNRMALRTPLAALAALISLWVSPLQAEPRAGILPVAGDPTIAGRLDRELGRAIAEQGIRGVLGPAELVAELGAAAGVKRALEEAGALLDQSARLALYMKRAEAVDHARRAIQKLEEILALHHAAPLLARAHGALARALLLKPADEEGAREAFRAAIAAAPDFRGESLPPRAAQLLEAARGQARVQAPAVESFGKLAARARLGAVLWIAARPRGVGQVELELVCFLASEGNVRAHLHESGRLENATGLAAKLAARVLRPAAASAPAASAPASGPPLAALPVTLPAPEPRQPPRQATAPPWYRSFWVWTVAAVVVTGAGLGLGLGLGLRSKAPPPGFDFEFTY